MATAPSRPDLVENIHRVIDDMHRTASDMKETVFSTRAVIEVSREQMREADRRLKTH